MSIELNTTANETAPQPATEPYRDLRLYTAECYSPGRGIVARTLWYFVSLVVFESGWFPLSGIKRALLRAFGAKIGCGVVIKPHVRIKFPWRLSVGDHSWIGEGVWIDNLAPVYIGSHACVSQQTYLCTGGHDYRRRSFDLITLPITLENGAWIAAGCNVLGGATIGTNSVVGLGSVVTRSVNANTIVAGNPAREIASHLEEEEGPDRSQWLK